MPTVPSLLGVDVGAADQVVHRLQRVVNHHSPEHAAVPERVLEEIELRAFRALAENPRIEAQRVVTQRSQEFRVRRFAHVLAAFQKFGLADLVAAAVRVIEQHRGKPACLALGPGEICRRGLLAIEVDDELLERVGFPVFRGDELRADLTIARRQFAEQTIQLLAAGRCGEVCMGLRARHIRVASQQHRAGPGLQQSSSFHARNLPVRGVLLASNSLVLRGST